MNWLPIVLAVGALVWASWPGPTASGSRTQTTRRLVDIDQKLVQLQTQVANVAKAKPRAPAGSRPEQGLSGQRPTAPTKGNPTAPIVIAEFSDYQ